MKKVLPAFLCLTLCVAVAFVLPQLGTSTEFVDDEVCMTCHDHDDLSDNHSDCDICHESGFTAPPASTCIECHPLGDTGTCNLVDVHSFSDCLECHVECDEEPTTTTTTDVSTTTTTTDVTTTTTTPVTTTTTTVSGSNITVLNDTVLRSRWITIPALLAIEGNGTNFARGSSEPAYSPLLALIKLPPVVLGPELIWQMVLVNPSWLALAGDQTVTCTVDGDSDDFDITLLPGILDE